ncbi:MAG: HAMP domain-containing protein [Herpetosiphonaceae bacterium]|nr:HAMP domain-containing protein [Herpetosiphonaceae bacterium]
MSTWRKRWACRPRHRRRVRLFWQLLGTFALLIGFGIGGMTSLVGVVFRQIRNSTLPETLLHTETSWATSLGDYYLAHGHSWDGVEVRIEDWLALDTSLASLPIRYRLSTTDDQIIAQSGPEEAHPTRVSAAGTAPIVADGQIVGSFALFSAPSFNTLPIPRGRYNAPTMAPATSLEAQVRRSFALVGWSVGSVALGLAVLMSRRISSPLRRLTKAAQQVAAGDLEVRVPGSSIREVDTLAQAFNQMATDLAHAAQLRRNMTADVAHELRTPLTIIKGKLEGVLDGVYPGTPEHIAPVLEEADLLERLIDDLRVLSLAEAGQLALHREEVLLRPLLENVQRSFAAQAASQNVQLTLDDHGELPLIEVDPQRMQQVLGNLVANSLRHTPPGGTIQLRATLQGPHVQLVVTDTGSGIAPDELPHIFDRFWRSDRARSRQGSGAGLGLAIARQLIETQGGQINAQSQLGQGTTITITLPLATELGLRTAAPANAV